VKKIKAMKDSQSVFFLAEQKSFDALSQREQDLVLQTSSKEEFEELHRSIQASQQFFEARKVNIDPTVKLKLDRAFQTKYATRKTLWIRRSIPLWQAVAACFLVALISWAFLRSDTTKIMTETVYVYQTDTIFKEVPIVNEKPQLQAKEVIQNTQKISPVFVKRNQKPELEAEAISVAYDLEKVPKLEDSIMVFRSRIGQSIKDDTLLTNWGGIVF